MQKPTSLPSDNYFLEVCGIPKAILKECNWSPKHLSLLRKIFENKRVGVLASNKSRSGKTIFAASFIVALVEEGKNNGKSFVFMNYTDYLKAYKEDNYETLKRAARCAFLVLDAMDFYENESSLLHTKAVSYLLDFRVSNNLFTIITTRNPPNELTINLGPKVSDIIKEKFVLREKDFIL